MTCRAAGAQVDAGRRGCAIPGRREGIAACKVLRTPAAGARGAPTSLLPRCCVVLPCSAGPDGRSAMVLSWICQWRRVRASLFTSAHIHSTEASQKPDANALGLLPLRRTTTAVVAVWQEARPAVVVGGRSPHAATATAPRTPQPRHSGDPRPSKRLQTIALAELRSHTDVFGC